MSVVNTICRLWTLLLLLLSGEGRLQCRDDGNRPVDWLVAYKLPLMKESSNPIIRKGLGYVYITSDSIDSGWTLSAKSANGSDSFLGHSLKPLYETTINNDLLWLLYNDETPNKTVTFDLGHTKGIVLSEVDGGIWLVHSVPRYPPIPGTPQSAYSYPHSGTYFGQSFLCISLAMDQLDLVGLQLLYNEPQVYSSNIPSSFKQSASHLAAVTQHTRISTAPWYHQLQLSTIGGIPFVTFAKTKKFGKDLYADWVAPSLKTNMLVETWPNGKGRLPSECQQPYNWQVWQRFSSDEEALQRTRVH
ncbi:deoxyribonuclease-2-alpha isoform X2 [Anabrus simplex]|uniref:deoxyribonuclease-2-alpha isoform X2 n=1 Tax=Anabrus simplex TaxID=316456 RepID=UPI0034DD32D6